MINLHASRPQTVFLNDYTPPDYRIETVELHFDLEPERTTVTARLDVHATYDLRGGTRPLVLNGQELELVSVAVDKAPVPEEGYEADEASLTIRHPAAHFHLEIVTRINPTANTALEGLYVSGGNFCTQCEAEGFRKITYFLDRPDVMARYTTTLVADKARYPVLLSNGDLIDSGDAGSGRHYAVWRDPFPKPSYLFALVAGDLALVADRFTTMSGRDVALRLYVNHGNEDKTDHAMRSLKRAMRWDEEVYGREYDLDTYMIVAVDDFNMGAMENKGLNLFNSRYVLARPDTATDTDYVNIEGVIGHEYFHNWSGNRITCRDWFQLSLKEGFTVFRDSQFTADMTSKAVKRIDDARLMRTRQFAEDAGPMAHPVRPDSYVEINNFYTLTVYEKGAEVVRMLHTLLGAGGFRKGTDLYFERYDGQAVTCDDFCASLEEANGVDLSQFKRWYSQAGTPTLEAIRRYDAANRRFELTLRQSCPPTPGQPRKEPFIVPVRIALLDRETGPLPLRLAGEPAASGHERVLALTEAEQTFVFEDIAREPVPSLLRDFSAPVKLKADLSDDELAFLSGHDTDPFNRWDAGQQLALRVMDRLLATHKTGGELVLDAGLSAAFGRTLSDAELDPALVAEALTLPSEDYVAECVDAIDPQAIHTVREFLRRELARIHAGGLTARYDALADNGPYAVDAAAMGRRRLRNVTLNYLLVDGGDAARAKAVGQFRDANNMTEVLAALSGLVHHHAPEHHEALEHFYRQWRRDPLVLDKWFTLQATAPTPEALVTVQRLVNHQDFNLKNPNRVRAVIGAFASANPAGFHRRDGAAYAFLADQVLALDALNPQIAARLVQPLTRWRRFVAPYQAEMRVQLERILAAEKLSNDLYEVVSKGLAE